MRKKEQNRQIEEIHRCRYMDLHLLSVLSSGSLVHRVLLFSITAHLSPHFYKSHKYCFYQESLHPIQTFLGKHYIHFLLAGCFFRDSSKVSISHKTPDELIRTNTCSEKVCSTETEKHGAF